MIYVVTFLHVVVCLLLIIVVLLQSGKAADLAGAFGGMGSQTAFGPRGAATFLSKATTIAAAVFILTSLTLSVMATRGGGGGKVGGSSVLEKAAPPPAQKTATPTAPGVPINIDTGSGQPTTVTIPKDAPEAPAQKAPAAPAKK